MQTIYATHLPLPTMAEGEELNAAIRGLSTWVHRRFDVGLAPLTGGTATTEQANVNWSLLNGDAGGLFGVWVDQPDPRLATWRWRTYIDLGVENREAWFRVRVNLYTTQEGVLTLPDVAAGRPGVVRELVDSLYIEQDGRKLGSVIDVAQAGIEDFLTFVESPDRQLPVVAISSGDGEEVVIDPVRAADRLLGLAHVAVLDFDAAWALTNAFGKRLSCFGGAVRVYWPAFSPKDDPYRHRLYVGGALTFHGPEGLLREIFDLLGRLAGLGIDEPKLRRTLILERRKAEIDRQAEERATAMARAAEVVKDSDYISATEFTEFARQYDELSEDIKKLRFDALGVEHELDRVRAERDEARRQIVELSRNYPPGATVATAIVDVDEASPRSVLEAVERARSEARATVYLDEAFESAGASEYGDPQRVFDDLRLIDEVARDWAAGDLAAGPTVALTQRSSAFRRDISQTAKTTYGTDYERVWNDETVMLGPHLRRGVGSVASILRIYMYMDTSQHKIVIGHVGRKLRDDSNRN